MKQNKEDYKIAKWYQRLIGFAIDHLIFFGPLLSADRNQEYIILCYFLYILLSEAVFNKTIGKLITCTVVRDKQNLGRASFIKCLGRTACRMIPFEAFSFLEEKPVGWHDSISGTVVVNSVYSYSAFFNRFKLFSKGFIRLNIAVSVIIGLFTFGLGFIGYWVLLRVILWILDGYKEEELKKVVSN